MALFFLFLRDPLRWARVGGRDRHHPESHEVNCRPEEGGCSRVSTRSTPFQMEPASLGFHLIHSRSIASADASLVGVRAALRDRLKVFLPWQSYGKNN